MGTAQRSVSIPAPIPSLPYAIRFTPSSPGKKEKGLPTESGDLLAVLDELDLDTLANGGVGLLGLNTDLLEDDALGVGGTTERRGLEGGSEEALLVVKVGPFVVAAAVGELAPGVQATGLSFTHLGGLWSKSVNCDGRLS